MASIERLPLLPLDDPAALAQAWLVRFPADYWYRRKHRIPLLSPEHRALPLSTARVWLEEQKLLRRLRTLKPDPKPLTPEQTRALPLFRPPGSVEVAGTAAEVAREFDALPLDQFDEPGAMEKLAAATKDSP